MARAIRVGYLLVPALLSTAHADIIISEVHPSGSGNAPYAADFFELTNTGPAAVDITGWKIDDNSNSFSLAVAFRGVTSIPAGASAIFAEGDATGSNDATIQANFRTAWFGGSAPAGFLMGGYGGSGVGLSTTADAVNIYDAGGALITRVGFGASTNNISFDNAAGLSGAIALTQLSAPGINNAFVSPAGETGSPGAVPTPASIALLALGGLRLLARSRKP